MYNLQLHPNQLYDIRRVIETATSSGVEIEQGNDVLISDVLNVYTDGDTDGYVASNSFLIMILQLTLLLRVQLVRLSLDGKDFLTGEYSFIDLHHKINQNIKFIQGDPVVYKPQTEVLSGLESGRTYYVDPIIPPANQTYQK